MSLVVPDTYKAIVLGDIVHQTLHLRLYSNNITPSGSTVFANLTEVAGGGYAEIDLLSGSWSIVLGVATYTPCNFHFSGVTNAPGTIYGYYISDASDNLILAELFPTPPFTPVGGSLVRITPRIEIT